MPPEGPPGTDAFRKRIWCSLQAAQKEGSGQGAARFLIVSILKSRIPRTLISPRDPVSYLRRAAWSAILRPGRPPEPAASPQESGSRGGRRCPPQAMVPFCDSDQRNPGGSGHSVFRSPPKTAITPPRRRRHAALCISFFGFPSSPRMCCPLLRSCIRRRISEPDPGSRFFSFVKYVMYSRSRVSGGGAHRFPQGKSH